MDMRNILSVNAGSSSLRLAAFTLEGEALNCLIQQHFSLPAGDDARGSECIRRFVAQHAFRPVLIAHRVVHGGEAIIQPVCLNGDVERSLESLQALAPLHLPRELALMRTCRDVCGEDIVQVVVPDTAFYADLPAVARRYALPRALCEAYGLRRYGFHGIAHQSMLRQWKEVAQGRTPQGGRVISLQLGSGCSITASQDGKPRDTSMGFTPLEGLVMATRAGDVDPGVLLYLQEHQGISAVKLRELLNRDSGLRGVSGLSDDMQTLLNNPAPAAQEAIDLYCYRARKYLGAYLAVLGGTDAIIFGGGVGEHSHEVRARILVGLEWAGIRLDASANRQATGARACISSADSTAAIWVMPVDEAAELARSAMAAVSCPG